MFYLSVFEDLERIQRDLSDLHGRPCYLVGADTARTYFSMKTVNQFFRKPDSTEYTQVSVWERLISKWDCKFVKRETPEGLESTYDTDLFYWDLVPSNFLKLLMPFRADERRLRRDKGLTEHDLFEPLESGMSITVPIREEMPEELLPYSDLYRSRPGIKKYPVVHFNTSEAIQAPNEIRTHWHLTSFPKVKFQTIQPPGQYNGIPIPLLQNHNQMARTDQEPGPCIVCHGVSGERVHLSILKGDLVYPTGSICRACTKWAFVEWQKLLDVQEA